MKKRKLLLILASLLVLGNLWAQGDPWYDDFEAAKAEAKSTGKYILVNFSGSDWCVWCIKLSDEVLKQDNFVAYAENNLVLFTADFPRRKQQPASLKQQNENLAKKYKIRGFPTVLILDPDGNLVQQTGYRQGGPDPYVKHIQEIIKADQQSKG